MQLRYVATPFAGNGKYFLIYLLFTVWTHFSGNVLTALIFHFANLGVVGILLEVHRTGHVVVDPDTQKKGDHGSQIISFLRRSSLPIFKAKKGEKESTLFNRISINTVLENPQKFVPFS